MSQTPSSLHWLARNYSRGKGAAERKRERIRALEERRAFYHRIVKSFDKKLASMKLSLELEIQRLSEYQAALTFHEVPVADAAIVPVRPHELPRTTGYGEMTRIIYRALRLAPSHCLTTGEIAQAVMEAKSLDPAEREVVRSRVLVRLAIMARQNRLLRDDAPKFTQNRTWRLPQLGALIISKHSFSDAIQD